MKKIGIAKFGILGGGAMLLSAGAVVAQTEAKPKQETAQPAEGDAKKEKKICRTEKMTGSLTRRTRICLTAAEWRQLQNKSKQGLDDFIGDAGGGCQAPSDPMKGSMC